MSDGWPTGLVKAFEKEFGPLLEENADDPQRVVRSEETYDEGFDSRKVVRWHVDGSGNLYSQSIIAQLRALCCSSEQVADFELNAILGKARSVLRAANIPTGSSYYWKHPDSGEWIPAHDTRVPAHQLGWRKVREHQVAVDSGFEPGSKEVIASKIIKHASFIQRRHQEHSQDDEVDLAWRELGRLENCLDAGFPHPRDPLDRSALQAFAAAGKRVNDARRPRADNWHKKAIAYCNRRLQEEANAGRTMRKIQLARELHDLRGCRRGLKYLEQLVAKWAKAGDITFPARATDKISS